MVKKKSRTDAPLLLGVTGGIASGKSTVANMLLELGVPTLLVLNMDDERAASGKTIDTEKLSELTGCPVLINTSFNVRGEPIVCSPEDAYRCFMRTEMDYLV